MGHLRRECIEEKCTYEEAREVFEHTELTVKSNYIFTSLNMFSIKEFYMTGENSRWKKMVLGLVMCELRIDLNY